LDEALPKGQRNIAKANVIYCRVKELKRVKERESNNEDKEKDW